VHGFDELAAEKVARAVITWDEKAPPVDSNVWSWLYQSVLQAGMAEVQNQQFPTISASIRELHLAALPERNASSRSSGDGPSRVHKTLLEAASAAMKSAFETLPREELLDEIRQGHPLIRAAALEGGGGRLSDEHLPILVAHANGNEQPLAQAAIHALRHFSHPRAIETLKTHAAGGPVRPRPMTLKELARRGAKIETSQAAQESLAASRFAAAHEALMDVLREADAERKRSIVQVLARHPRPMWSETIYRFVKDPDSGINVEALKALVTVGHPELFPLLKEALQSGRPELEAAAFATLAGRTDPESEELAMAYALEHLEKQPPTSEIQSLLHRTKDPRAMPLLLKHLRQVGSGRSSVIGLLARIGDETTAEILVDMYPSLSGSDKRAALQALMQLRAPVFRQLAGQALLSDDSSLISTASQGLSADASDEAERLLIEAFDKSSNSRAWMYLSNSLSQIATPESRAVLVKARDSNNAQKQQYAMNALRNMRSRSPGYQMLYQARHFEQQQKWGEAVERYDAAIKLDPDLPDAYAGRAEAFLKLDKLDQAEKDFRKASQLDPYSGKANSGLAILLARRDKVDEALKHIEDARKKAEKDRYDQGAFAYGAARVYSRAYGALQKTMDAPERDKKLAQYRKQALDDLQAAVNKGFRDFERIKSEADFAALKDLPEFQKIHSPNAKQPNATPQADVAEPADS
ncbi:MAG: HEAT repeat domain-containing protein, partial [Planctomycetes bacterium]|nr:HEAT repeat domain-containing protein [Planctomycetota bacterium]